MTAAPYVLAGNMKQAHIFAREELGLRPGHYRVVTSADIIRVARGAKLYLVPGWQKSPIRFSVKTALRYTRMEVIDAEQGLGIPDNLQPSGKQLVLLSEWASGEEAFRNAMHQPIEETPSEVVPEIVEPAEPVEDKRRRRRCKDCGQLVHPDKVEAHAAEHLPEE